MTFWYYWWLTKQRIGRWICIFSYSTVRLDWIFHAVKPQSSLTSQIRKRRQNRFHCHTQAHKSQTVLNLWSVPLNLLLFRGVKPGPGNQMCILSYWRRWRWVCVQSVKCWCLFWRGLCVTAGGTAASENPLTNNPLTPETLIYCFIISSDDLCLSAINYSRMKSASYTCACYFLRSTLYSSAVVLFSFVCLLPTSQCKMLWLKKDF